MHYQKQVKYLFQVIEKPMFCLRTRDKTWFNPIYIHSNTLQQWWEQITCRLVNFTNLHQPWSLRPFTHPPTRHSLQPLSPPLLFIFIFPRVDPECRRPADLQPPAQSAWKSLYMRQRPQRINSITTQRRGGRPKTNCFANTPCPSAEKLATKESKWLLNWPPGIESCCMSRLKREYVSFKTLNPETHTHLWSVIIVLHYTTSGLSCSMCVCVCVCGLWLRVSSPNKSL